MWRLLRRLLVAGLLLLVLLVAVAGYIAWASLPSPAGTLTVEGLQGPVTIARDDYGVPRIDAEHEVDLYFAIGFVHAQDRLWQMEASRRIGQGRMAELLGADGVPIDRFMRTLGLYRKAEAALASLSDEARRYLDAYAAGVNTFLKNGSLPPEFWLLWHSPEPWRPADSLVWIKLMALDLSGNWRDEITRARLSAILTPEQLEDLWPQQPEGFPPSITASLDEPGQPSLTWLKGYEGLGSNIWMVAGDRTNSGAPILANDPHLTLRVPSPWYLASLNAPGIRVQGATMPSLPFVIIGQNDDIAWGFTNSNADVQDLFVEQVDPDDSSRYLTPEGSAPFDIRDEIIKVRGGGDIALRIRATRHGPVVSDIGGTFAGLTGPDQVLALQWTALRDQDKTAEAGFDLAKASDWQSFSTALQNFDALPQNTGFVARDGSIAMRLVGEIPIRRSGYGRIPAAGWTGEHDWIGDIPYVGLPATIDPPSGTIVNANNRLVGPDYPHFLTADWRPAERARRIQELLDAQPSDLATTAKAQNDIYSTLAQDFLPWLLPASSAEPDMQSALQDWDRVMRTEAPEPLMFTAWYAAFLEAVVADELGDHYVLFRGIRSDTMRHILGDAPEWCDDRTTIGREESCNDQAALAFDRAWQWLNGAYGDNWRAWRWGTAARVEMEHQPFDRIAGLSFIFNIRSEKGGDSSSINVSRYASAAPFDTVSAPSLRMIVDLGEPGIARTVAAAGQSGHPLSPHYRDLTSLWRAGEYLELDNEALPPDQTARTWLLQPDNR